MRGGFSPARLLCDYGSGARVRGNAGADRSGAPGRLPPGSPELQGGRQSIMSPPPDGSLGWCRRGVRLQSRGRSQIVSDSQGQRCTFRGPIRGRDERLPGRGSLRDKSGCRGPFLESHLTPDEGPPRAPHCAIGARGPFLCLVQGPMDPSYGVVLSFPSPRSFVAWFGRPSWP